MLKPKKREVGEFDASSMADITFLLLIFFLVTTTISSDKGVTFVIPSKPEGEGVKVKGVVNVFLNDEDKVLVGKKGKEEITELSQIKTKLQLLKREINAAGDSMIVSVKFTPGSTYKNYLEIIDQARSTNPKTISLAQ